MDIFNKAELILDRKKEILNRELTIEEENVYLLSILKSLAMSECAKSINLIK